MSTNKIILRNRQGAEVAAIFLDEDSRRWRIVSVSPSSSAISLLRKKPSIHGTPISTQRRESVASNQHLVQRTIHRKACKQRTPTYTADSR